MAEMIATTLALGDPAPEFALRDTTGAEHVVPAEDAPPATVLVVTCNHCPYVHRVEPAPAAVAEDYQPRDVRFLAINANDATPLPGRQRRTHEALRRASRGGRSPTCTTRARRSPARSTPRSRRTCSSSTTSSALVYHGAPDADHQDPGQDARAGCARRSTRCSPASRSDIARDQRARLLGEVAGLTAPTAAVLLSERRRGVGGGPLDPGAAAEDRRAGRRVSGGWRPTRSPPPSRSSPASCASARSASAGRRCARSRPRRGSRR